MRKIKEILRLKFEAGQGQRQIARSCGVGKTTVAECLARFERSGLSWPQAGQLDETALEHKLYPPPPMLATDRQSWTRLIGQSLDDDKCLPPS